MKTYTWPQLKALVREQSYKMAAVENQQGERVIPFNAYKKNQPNLDAQFKVIQTRLKGEAYPDGIYWLCLAHNINSARNPHRYAIMKGKVTEEQAAAASTTVIERHTMTQAPVDRVLGWDNAVAMNRQIAELTAEVSRLKFENGMLRQQIAEMEMEAEEEPGLLGDGSVSGLKTFLSETLPQMMPAIDRYFELEGRKLDLEEMKLKSNNGHNGHKRSAGERREIVPGTQDHLNLIEYYYSKNDEGKLNAELDKLEAVNRELYHQVLERLGMTEEEEPGSDTAE